MCLLLSAFYSGSESAFISLTPAQLERLRKEKGRRSRLIYTLRKDTPVLLTTVLIGNNFMNIALTVIASNMTIRLSGSALLGATTAMLTLCVLVLGEIYPKQLAIYYNEKWARRAAYPVYISKYLFMPLTLVIHLLTQGVLARARTMRTNEFTRDNVLQQIHAATALGVLKRHTSHLLVNTLMFESDTAEMIMTHRTKILSVPLDTPVVQALEIIYKSGFSRLPVYDRNPEKIVGIILLKDLLHLHLHDNQQQSIAHIMHSPLVITQSMRLDRVFLQMRRKQQHMAIVLDEYGGLAGLITLEDLFEKIYGQLYDEHDQVERTIVPYGAHSYIITASIPIHKMNEQFGLDIPTNRGMTALSGYLIQLYGNVPPAYAIISSPYGSFEIIAASKRKIHKVIFRKRAPVLRE